MSTSNKITENTNNSLAFGHDFRYSNAAEEKAESIALMAARLKRLQEQSPEKAFLIFSVRKSDEMISIKEVLAKVALAILAIPGKNHLSLVVSKWIDPPPPPPNILQSDL